MNIDHYCLHPAINKYFLNGTTNNNILHEIVSILNSKPENLINISEANTEEVMLAPEKEAIWAETRLFYFRKHHYSKFHHDVIRNKSRRKYI